MKKICAITGTGGYLGSCVKHYLEMRGWEVRELTRHARPGTTAVGFELGADVPGRALAGVDALIHCAYDFRAWRWEAIREVNVVGSEKLFHAAQAAGVGKIIHISSISAFEGCRSLYGKAKLEIEKRAVSAGAQVIRPGLIYGRGPGGMFGKLTKQIRESSVIPLIGDGSQIQFLVHQDDLSAFVEHYADGRGQISAKALTVANEEPWPFKRLLLRIAGALDRKVTFVPLPWRVVWAGLKTAELCGVKINFRSDSVISLMHPNPRPDFWTERSAGLTCRPFDIQSLKE